MVKVDCAVGPPSFVGPKLQCKPRLGLKGLEHVLVGNKDYFYL